MGDLEERLNAMQGELAEKELQRIRLAECLQVVLVSEACINASRNRRDLNTAARNRQVAAAIEQKNHALERAHARGLIEWGVSIRTAWPTPEGRAMLEHAGLPATGVPPQLTPDADDCIGLRVLCQVGTEIRSAFYQPVRQHLWRDADRDQLKLVLQVDLRILLEQDQLQVLAFEPYTIGPPAPTV